MKKLVRVGTCVRCGKCCHMLNIVNTKANSGVDLSFLSSLSYLIQCTYFEYDEFGRASCKVFNDVRRPEACILHPSSPTSMVEGCKGYRFYCEEKSDGEV